MERKEWLAQSQDWREGYRACTFNWTIVNWDEKSEDWKAGFDYAMRTAGQGSKKQGLGGEDACLTL